MIFCARDAIAQTLPKPRGVFEAATDRPLRYTPDAAGGFVIETRAGVKGVGGEFFNRPLYGSNTAFRVDAGDLPEFMVYLPNRGGNLRIGMRKQGADGKVQTKWLHAADRVVARYADGAMTYEIHDAWLGNGVMTVAAVPMHASEGLVLKLVNTGEAVDLVYAFGGNDGRAGSRRGDIGTEAQPVTQYFQLTADACRNNQVTAEAQTFSVTNATRIVKGVMTATGGTGPISGVADAALWNDAEKLVESVGKATTTPLAVSHLSMQQNVPYYLALQDGGSGTMLDGLALPKAFDDAVASRRAVATRIAVDTPDLFINAAAGALCIAADAVWDEATGTVMHGGVAWRSKLLGWRGPYVLDDLGWHDRMTRHVSWWATQQIVTEAIPATPHADPKKNLATDDWTMLHTNGDITKSHYDMNLAYVDYYMRHALWTGDLDLLKKTWPVLQRHLAWEQRCFRRLVGPDGDKLPLYEAYAAIWASDNLQYDGAGTAHASALNYFHNRMAARVAALIGEDPKPYTQEADLIQRAMKRELWVAGKGVFAEYKDILGPQTVMDAPALWSYYHTVDSEAADAFEAYQMGRYVDTAIAHIPMKGTNVPAGTSVLASSNWMPYIWSINNVCPGENAATALADWQGGGAGGGGRSGRAFATFKGNVLDNMFVGLSPGNVHMASYFDAYRGESQRDFADPTAMMTRALIEGLFGVRPDVLAGEVTWKPGFPAAWDHVALKHPDFTLSYTRGAADAHTESYVFEPHFAKPVRLKLVVAARGATVAKVTVNGQAATWSLVDSAVGMPEILVPCATGARFKVDITWGDVPPAAIAVPAVAVAGSTLTVPLGAAEFAELFDPQQITTASEKGEHRVALSLANARGPHTAFVKLKQGDVSWWTPIDVDVRPPFEILTPKEQVADRLTFLVRNNAGVPFAGKVHLACGGQESDIDLQIAANGTTEMTVASGPFYPGTTPVRLSNDKGVVAEGMVTNWKPALAAGTAVTSTIKAAYEPVDLSPVFNASVAGIFKAEYLSPRSPYVSLAIPKQGIGGWADNTKTAAIDDTGLRAAAARNGGRIVVQGVPFVTPGDAGAKNVAFTSFWDNHPKQIAVPLTGNARHVYLLMAGTTNAMRSRIKNGEVVVTYADKSSVTLTLENPTTWWPIEQDYLVDDYSFALRAGGGDAATPPALPPRVDLRTGQVRVLDYATFAGRGGAVNGGAATVLDLPLDPAKALESLTIRPSTYEVIIGTMSATLAR